MSSQTFTEIESAALRATGGQIPNTRMLGPLFRPSTRYLVTGFGCYLRRRYPGRGAIGGGALASLCRKLMRPFVRS